MFSRQKNVRSLLMHTVLVVAMVGVLGIPQSVVLAGSFIDGARPHGGWASTEPPPVLPEPDYADGAEGQSPYNAGVVYAGIFDRSQLYRMDLDRRLWAGSLHPTSISKVTCRAARTALTRHGAWRGALKTNGSCGSGEPVDWAVGNFLNYQGALQGEQ